MEFRPFYIFSIFALILSTPVFSQELNISGDTIRVSSDANPSIIFPDEILNASTLCATENYTLPVSNNRIIIRPGVDRPFSPCVLTVDEGPKNNQRHHRFVLIFVNAPVSDLVYDYSTTDALKQRIEFLANQKKRASAAPVAPAPAVAATTPAQPEMSFKSDAENYYIDGIAIDKAAFQKHIDNKVLMFNRCCEKLCQKKQNNLKATIDYGMGLFNNNEDRLVSVTSKSGVPNTKPIRKYLTNMSNLPYSSVQMKWNNSAFLGNFHKNADGKWYGTVVFEQEFTGFDPEGRVKYADKVKKQVEVVVEVFNAVGEDGKTVTKWDVYLANIGVYEEQK